MAMGFGVPCPKPEPRQRVKARAQRQAQKIVKSIRQQVVDRARGCCERCGRPCLTAGQAHHRIPRSRGGAWTLENIEFLCWPCHHTAHMTNRL